MAAFSSRTRAAFLALFALAPSPALAQFGDAALSRADELVLAIHRSGATQRCWNAFLAQNPAAPSLHFGLRVEVQATGSVGQVTLLAPAPPALADCIRTQLRAARLPAGPATTVTAHYGFSAGVPAPIPGASR